MKTGLRPSNAWKPLGNRLSRGLQIAALASDVGTFMQSAGGVAQLEFLHCDEAY